MYWGLSFWPFEQIQNILWPSKSLRPRNSRVPWLDSNTGPPRSSSPRGRRDGRRTGSLRPSQHRRCARTNRLPTHLIDRRNPQSIGPGLTINRNLIDRIPILIGRPVIDPRNHLVVDFHDVGVSELQWGGGTSEVVSGLPGGVVLVVDEGLVAADEEGGG